MKTENNNVGFSENKNAGFSITNKEEVVNWRCQSGTSNNDRMELKVLFECGLIPSARF